jgi:tetratricopeptide (TPR) repeat protein
MIKAKYAAPYYSDKVFLGLSLLYDKKLEQSAAVLTEALESPARDTTYAFAIVNIGFVYTLQQKYSSVVDFYANKLNEIGSIDIDPIDKGRLLAKAYYNLGYSYARLNQNDHSVSSFKMAIEASPIQQKPFLMNSLYEMLSSPSDKLALLRDCVNLVMSNRLKPTKFDPENDLAINHSTLNFLLAQSYEQDRSLFDELFAYVSLADDAETPHSSRFLSLAEYSTHTNNFSSATKFAKEVLKVTRSEEVATDVTAFQACKLLSLIGPETDLARYRKRYYRTLITGFRPEKFDYIDINIVSFIASKLLNDGKFKETVEFIGIANRFESLLPRDQMGDYLIVRYLEMDAFSRMRDLNGFRKACKETLIFSKKVNLAESLFRVITQNTFEEIQKITERRVLLAIFEFDLSFALRPRWVPDAEEFFAAGRGVVGGVAFHEPRGKRTGFRVLPTCSRQEPLIFQSRTGFCVDHATL